MLKAEQFMYAGGSPVDLRVAAGACAGISGASGSGKTRLLRALCDLDPWQGSLSLNGTAAHAVPAPDWRRRIGYLPAESQWWFDSVGEHFPAAFPFEPDFCWQAAGFEPDTAGWEISRLSSGEKQRLAILRLLVRRPQALLLDEPTAHLDEKNARQIEALLLQYRSQKNIPVIWVGHDKAQLERVADCRYLMHDGELVPQ